jgi:alanine racemase
VEEVAERAGVIPWEVMTSISRRVPRFYREP